MRAQRRAVIGVMMVMAAAAAGCSLRDAFSGHQDVVATAGGTELTVEHVASMLAPAKSVPLRRDVIERMADVWVDAQLLGQAQAAGDSLLDSATVDAANWPIVVQTIVNNYHDSAMAAGRPTAQQIDSAFNGASVRYISHILVRVKPDTTDAVKAAKRRIAQGYLTQLQHGANFAQLAGRVSEDPGSKAQGGSLGLFARGQMVKPFEDAAFALRPGELSPELVVTPFGYHILYRPTLAAVRDSFTSRLQDIMGAHSDSLFLDSLTTKSGLSVRGGAPQIVRAVARNLRGSKSRWRTLASWRGGKLDEARFATWLEAYGPQTRQAAQDPQVPDSSLREFVKTIARSEMLVRAAEQRHIGLTTAQRDSIRAHYRVELQTMITGMGIAPESLAADTSVRGATRTQIAARRVDAYLVAITSSGGGRQFYEVPPFLADFLRGRMSWRLNAAGVDRALERTRVLRGPETPQAGGMERAPIQPAPGGPPVGGPPPQGRRPVR
ncbi:MAG: peptidylprolyl isomerase [Gemmatimonadales bacterium]